MITRLVPAAAFAVGDPGARQAGCIVGQRRVWKVTFNALQLVVVTRECPTTPILLGDVRIKFSRVISTGKLNALQRLHRRPINQVVYLDPCAVLRRGESLSWEELGA